MLALLDLAYCCPFGRLRPEYSQPTIRRLLLPPHYWPPLAFFMAAQLCEPLATTRLVLPAHYPALDRLLLAAYCRDG